MAAAAMQQQLVAAAVEQSVLRVAQQLEDQLDSELHKLEHLQDDDLERLRAARIRDLKAQQARAGEWLAAGHGEYRELGDEKEFFREMKGEERMVAHFYRDNWPCKVVDKHLAILSQQHLETKFVKINAEKAPYLTEKLKVWMLPTLALIKHEKVVDYVVGFDQLGGTDDFSTATLEERLAAADVVKHDASLLAAQRAAAVQQQRHGGIRRGEYVKAEDDEDSDFDS